MSKLGNVEVRFNYKGKERIKTTCIIKNASGEIIAEEFVKKSREDSNNKLIGRRNAFKKAMTQARNSLTRNERKTIWNDFVENINQPE